MSLLCLQELLSVGKLVPQTFNDVENRDEGASPAYSSRAVDHNRGMNRRLLDFEYVSIRNHLFEDEVHILEMALVLLRSIVFPAEVMQVLDDERLFFDGLVERPRALLLDTERIESEFEHPPCDPRVDAFYREQL